MRSTVFAAVVTVVVAASGGAADATTMAFVHGRNAGTPSTTEACEYWGGSAGCTCTGTNSAGYATSGWCGYAGGSTSTFGRVVVRYDAARAWWDEAVAADPICDVAAEINAIADSDVRVVAHSAGNLVTLAILTDAANGWGGSCGAGVVTGASNKITKVAAVQGPFSGAKAADAVYGHLNNGGNVLTDWLHNFCGNTVGGIANIFADQATSMTNSLQTSSVINNRGWLSNSNGKPVYIAFGTGTSGTDSVWLGAAATCSGGSYNDGLVEAYSARACTNTGAGLTGSCTSKPANFYDQARAKIGHSSGRRGDYVTTTDQWASYNWTSAHSHGMSDLVWNHTSI
jgi:hypothetical protein